MSTLQLRLENQQNPVADEVEALIAVVRPVLEGTLYSLKQDVVKELGAYAQLKLKMLARLYKRGDGDCGICFEYAVHDALRRREGSVSDRVEDALTKCNIPGSELASILFGAEKGGKIDLIETAKELLTPDSRLRYGSKGQPVKLINHIHNVAAAFRKPSARKALPYSISGLWKADLFVGHTDEDRRVGTTVKINRAGLESARGLRIGIVPAAHGSSDRVKMDDQKNLVICPLPYDGAFMEIFYRGWFVVQQFIDADAKLPKEANLPNGADRIVAQSLAERREFPVVDVIEALRPLAQPELLETTTRSAEVFERRSGAPDIGAAITPLANIIDT